MPQDRRARCSSKIGSNGHHATAAVSQHPRINRAADELQQAAGTEMVGYVEPAGNTHHQLHNAHCEALRMAVQMFSGNNIRRFLALPSTKHYYGPDASVLTNKLYAAFLELEPNERLQYIDAAISLAQYLVESGALYDGNKIDMDCRRAYKSYELLRQQLQNFKLYQRQMYFTPGAKYQTALWFCYTFLRRSGLSKKRAKQQVKAYHDRIMAQNLKFVDDDFITLAIKDYDTYIATWVVTLGQDKQYWEQRQLKAMSLFCSYEWVAKLVQHEKLVIQSFVACLENPSVIHPLRPSNDHRQNMHRTLLTALESARDRAALFLHYQSDQKQQAHQQQYMPQEAGGAVNLQQQQADLQPVFDNAPADQQHVAAPLQTNPAVDPASDLHQHAAVDAQALSLMLALAQPSQPRNPSLGLGVVQSLLGMHNPLFEAQLVGQTSAPPPVTEAQLLGVPAHQMPSLQEVDAQIAAAQERQTASSGMDVSDYDCCGSFRSSAMTYDSYPSLKEENLSMKIGAGGHTFLSSVSSQKDAKRKKPSLKSQVFGKVFSCFCVSFDDEPHGLAVEESKPEKASKLAAFAKKLSPKKWALKALKKLTK